MASIFISHSSKDNALAKSLESWLSDHGFWDVFIDYNDIHAGSNWVEELKKAHGECRVIIFLVTANWLASKECSGEFNAGYYAGKRLIPLFLTDGKTLDPVAASDLARVRHSDQGIDLTPILTADQRLDFSTDELIGLQLAKGLRAAGALASVGLDPEAFDIDRSRRPTPFPGLTSFSDDDADAALFYGRSREIAETLEALRAMRATSERRPLVIIGASGSGKSSLLRAGIVPRLRREAPAWIPLRVFRPGADPMRNFAEAIGRTLSDFHQPGAFGDLHRTLMEVWRSAPRAGNQLTAEGRKILIDALESIGERLRRAANRPLATILISIDQAEEIARYEGAAGDALADYLRATTEAPNSWMLAFTIRTDSFPELQKHYRFEGLQTRGYDLRALPTFRFGDVVDRPARRYNVEVEPLLVDELVADAPQGDALPLLAFVLEQLWDQFALNGRLRLADYQFIKAEGGLINKSAERALAGLEPDQRDNLITFGGPSTEQVALARRTFVPHLVDLNDEGGLIRRIAVVNDFTAEQKVLIERFVRWRLLITRETSNSGMTVEVAHEAIFSEWQRLREEWLEPERSRLEALRGLRTACALWVRNGKRQAFLVHFSERLAAAMALGDEPRYASELLPDEQRYLELCAREQRRMDAAQTRFRTLAVLAALSIAAIGMMFVVSNVLEIQQQSAVRSRILADSALTSYFQGDYIGGLRKSLMATRSNLFSRATPEATQALATNLDEFNLVRRFPQYRGDTAFAEVLDHNKFLIAQTNGKISLIGNAIDGKPFEEKHFELNDKVKFIRRLDNGILIIGGDKSVLLFDPAHWKVIGRPILTDENGVIGWFFDEKLNFINIFINHKTSIDVWNASEGKKLASLSATTWVNRVLSYYSLAGRPTFCFKQDGRNICLDGSNGAILPMPDALSAATEMWASGDRRHIIVADKAGNVKILDSEDFRPIAMKPITGVAKIATASEAPVMVIADKNGSIRRWSTDGSGPLGPPVDLGPGIESLAISSDGFYQAANFVDKIKIISGNGALTTKKHSESCNLYGARLRYLNRTDWLLRYSSNSICGTNPVLRDEVYLGPASMVFKNGEFLGLEGRYVVRRDLDSGREKQAFAADNLEASYKYSDGHFAERLAQAKSSTNGPTERYIVTYDHDDGAPTIWRRSDNPKLVSVVALPNSRNAWISSDAKTAAHLNAGELRIWDTANGRSLYDLQDKQHIRRTDDCIIGTSSNNEAFYFNLKNRTMNKYPASTDIIDKISAPDYLICGTSAAIAQSGNSIYVFLSNSSSIIQLSKDIPGIENIYATSSGKYLYYNYDKTTHFMSAASLLKIGHWSDDFKIDSDNFYGSDENSDLIMLADLKNHSLNTIDLSTHRRTGPEIHYRTGKNSPNFDFAGKKYILAVFDRDAEIYDIYTGKPANTVQFATPIKSHKFSRAANRLIIWAEDGTVQILDTLTMKVIHKFQWPIQDLEFGSVGFSASDKELYVYQKDRIVVVDPVSGKLIATRHETQTAWPESITGRKILVQDGNQVGFRDYSYLLQTRSNEQLRAEACSKLSSIDQELSEVAGSANNPFAALMNWFSHKTPEPRKIQAQDASNRFLSDEKTGLDVCSPW